jgi:hypothetical protein
MRFDKIILAAALVLVVAEVDAHAYTDPGTGTLILQVLMAAVFGAMFYLRRLISWVRGLKGGARGSAQSEPDRTEN